MSSKPTCGLVEDEDIRFLDQSPGNCYPLLLTSGKLCSTCSNMCLEAIRLQQSVPTHKKGRSETYEITDELAIGLAGSSDNFGTCRMRNTIGDILRDGS